MSAPATLEMIAARIYPTMPIEHPVDRLYPDAPFVRLLAVGTAIEQLPNVVDLSWSMAWSAAMLDREVNTVLALAAVALWLTRQGADGERWIRDAIASDIRASL
ncbi:hypothetical protein [Metallibacterium scheffleri]|uniref:hypothetical protein n=1 Tax=Metallibacterium scheffleri TaxID=993689 RepID=UPI00109FC6D0|nr:hypothetical protein [Metallibacterium scheffleri]